jgi:hypothetical protein
MATKSNVLGVDRGSVSISIAVAGPERDVIRAGYSFHHGKIADTRIR